MEDNAKVVSCPVCTLYLREGVTLQEHLNTHPKEQVIEALVRYSGVCPIKASAAAAFQGLPNPDGQPISGRDSPGSRQNATASPHFASIPYQQFLSSFSPVPRAAPVVPQPLQMVFNPYPVYPQPAEHDGQVPAHSSHHHMQYLPPNTLIRTPYHILSPHANDSSPVSPANPLSSGDSASPADGCVRAEKETAEQDDRKVSVTELSEASKASETDENERESSSSEYAEMRNMQFKGDEQTASKGSAGYDQEREKSNTDSVQGSELTARNKSIAVAVSPAPSSPSESEEPTNLCLRRDNNRTPSAPLPTESVTPANTHAVWMPQNPENAYTISVYQCENGDPFPARHIVHNGQIVTGGSGTIIDDGEGRTLLNLSESGPMSILELEGMHVLIPSHFIDCSASAAGGQQAKPVPDDAPPPPYQEIIRSRVPAEPPPVEMKLEVVRPNSPPPYPADTLGAGSASEVPPPPPYPKRPPSPEDGEERHCEFPVRKLEDKEAPSNIGDSAPPSPSTPTSPSSPSARRPESPMVISINIRTDETMPAHGEISEQESVGGNSSSMWPEQGYSSSKDQPTSLSCYDIHKARETCQESESTDYNIGSHLQQGPRFAPQEISFSSSVPPSAIAKPEPNPEPKKRKQATPRVPKCRSCQMTFDSPAERRAHVCEKKKKKVDAKVGSVTQSSVFNLSETVEIRLQPSTSESVLEVQKPKRVYKRKPKDQVQHNQEEVQFGQLADVLVNKLETNESPSTLATVDRLVGHIEPEKNGVPIVKDPLKAFKCEYCDLEFPSYRIMARHRKEHKARRYTCATCGEAFELEAQYHLHLMVHPLECKLCGKFFYRRQNMALHMRRHMSVKPYQCEHCDKSFVTKQKLDEHSNSHTGNAPIKCPLCNETFRRHSNLVQHKNRHHFNIKRKQKDFICHCGEVCHTKKKLEWHKEIHDEKPKSCSFCNERFVHASSLTRHVRRAHDQRYVPRVGRETENVECTICQAVFLKSSLAVHMRTHTGARPYPCHICGKNFTTKWNLQLHRWTHASRSTKPFKCTMCKSAFYRRSDYTSHMRSHRNMRPYTCNFCGCQFIRKYNCIRHMNEHEKGKSYSCTICEKTFHRSYYLKEHMRVHSGTRPFSCHICGKASSSKSNHNKHVKIHHAREPQNTEN